MKYGSMGAIEEKLHADEPVFVLRGQDLLAPYAIMEYAALLRAAAAGRQGGSHASFGDSARGAADVTTLRMRSAASECESHAAYMLGWQANNPDKTKLPD